jgi:hypothetical protein
MQPVSCNAVAKARAAHATFRVKAITVYAAPTSSAAEPPATVRARRVTPVADCGARERARTSGDTYANLVAARAGPTVSHDGLTRRESADRSACTGG